jgi:glycosyltransferase involved in cell wall biosynthesis
MRVVHEYSRHLHQRGHEVEILFSVDGGISHETGRALTRFQRFERRVKHRLKVARRCLKAAFVLGPSVAVRHALRHVAGTRKHGTSCLDPHTAVRFVRDFDPDRMPDGDALIVYDWTTALRAAALPERCGRKFYLIQADESLLGVPERRARAAYQLPYELIVVSSWLKARMRDRYAQDAAGPVLNGIDFRQFHDTGGDSSRSRRVGMIYWSAPYKASRDGLQALAGAREHFRDLEVILFGRDVPDRRLPDYARFHYDPPQDTLRDLYSSCGVWLSPSLIEGGGMPVQEAMACGCAVVATDVGAVRDFGRPGDNLLVVPPGDVPAMSRPIISLLEDKRLREQLAAAAKADIRRYTWERATDQFEDILERGVSGR